MLSRRTLFTVLSSATLAASLSGCILSTTGPMVVEQPQIQARAVQFLRSDGNSASMRIELVGYNPNPFDMYTQTIRAQLSIAGQPLGNAEASFLQVMSARRPIVVLVEVNLTGISAVAPLVASAQQRGMGSLPFRVDGAVMMRSRGGDTSVPFTFSGYVAGNAFSGLNNGQ